MVLVKATYKHPCEVVDIMTNREVALPVSASDLGDAHMMRLSLAERDCSSTHIIVDLRVRTAFEAGHLHGSINAVLAESSDKSSVHLHKSHHVPSFKFHHEDEACGFDEKCDGSTLILVTEDGLAESIRDGLNMTNPVVRSIRCVASSTNNDRQLLFSRVVVTAHNHFAWLYGNDETLYNAKERASPSPGSDAGNHILGKLWLGGSLNASKLSALLAADIKSIINCAEECKSHFPDRFEYTELLAQDTPAYYLAKHFDQCESVINNAEGNVLVHCAMGRSRAASITVMFLMRSEKMSLYHAWLYVKVKRPEISINPGFMQLLVKEEMRIFNTREPSVAEQKSLARPSSFLDTFLYADRD